MLSFFLIASALAGKLQDDNGFRGKHFGPASVLEEVPMEGCGKNLQEGVLWTCKTAIGDYGVLVEYLVDEDLFWAVNIRPSKDESCQDLFFIFVSAWGNEYTRYHIEGTGRHSYKWSDVDVSVSFTVYSDNSCRIGIMNYKVWQEMSMRKTRPKK